MRPDSTATSTAASAVSGPRPPVSELADEPVGGGQLLAGGGQQLMRRAGGGSRALDALNQVFGAELDGPQGTLASRAGHGLGGVAGQDPGGVPVQVVDRVLVPLHLLREGA